MNVPVGHTQAARPFVRVLVTPAGLPWDQARAVKLEAEHTSPVPLKDVTVILRRLTPWGLNRAGRFAAVYVRDHDARSLFTVEVEGQSLRIDLSGAGSGDSQWLPWVVRGGLTVLILAGMLAISLTSLQKREEAGLRLATAEARMNQQVREARRLARAQETDQALKGMGLEERTANAALGALDQFSRAKNPDARVDAFYWREGEWGVEVRGETSATTEPLPGLERSAEPVRKGVWLWRREPQP